MNETGIPQYGAVHPVPPPRRIDEKVLLGPLVTDRLVLAEAAEDDLPELIAVAQSNPEFLYAHHAEPGKPDSLTPIMVADDVVAARMDPFRHPLAIRQRGSGASGADLAVADGDIVGWAETLDRHPSDLCPWIGLLELHSAVQGRGLGREAALALIGWYQELGADRLRLAVDDGNDRAATFWGDLGFVFVERRPRAAGRSGPGDEVDILELRLLPN